MKTEGREFRLELKVGKETVKLNSSEFIITEETENSAVLSCETTGGSITVKLEQWKKDSEDLYRAELINNSSAVIKGFEYPIRRYERMSTADKLLMASAWGDCIPRPAKTIREVSFSPTIRFEQDYIRYQPNEIIYNYPSIMSMQYMTVFNDISSSYLATYSISDETMTFHARSLGKYDLELFVTHYPFLGVGSWVSPDCGEAKLGGGWHQAADLYRSHMNPHWKPVNSPEWIENEYHGWIEYIMKYDRKPPSITFKELPETFEKIRKVTGMNHLFLVGWHDNGHDTKFPRYLPTESAGTFEELKEAIADIHKMGGRISLYTNARLIDIYEEFYRDGGKNAVLLDENMQEYREDYHTESLYAVACPGCVEYTEQMKKVGRRIAGELGADGMFVDQISCNMDPFCYNPNHAHSKPSNNFLPGVEIELCGIRSAAHAVNPNFHMFAEGCHERFNQFYDVNQGHGEEYTWQIGESLPEQFLYTYPDRIVSGLCGNKHQMYHAMAQFKPLDIKPPCYTVESNHEPLQKYMALRRSFPQYFFGARFIDDEGLKYDHSSRLFAVVTEGGDLAVSLWKPGAIEDTKCEGFFIMPDGYEAITQLPFSDTEIIRDGDRVNVKWQGALTFLVLHKKA